MNSSRIDDWPRPGKRFAIALALVAIVSNSLNAHLLLPWPSGRTLGLGLFPFLVVAAIAWMVRRIGFRQAAFALLPTLIVLILLEAGVHAYYHGIADRRQKMLLAAPVTRGLNDWNVYEPHHYSLYNLNANLVLPEGTRHNHLGLRDDRALAPDERAIRIVFLGGSTTYTIHIPDNRRIFTAGLEERLQAHYLERLGARRIEVVNAGMGAATSAENLIRLAFLLSELDPDLIVIQHGLNDARVRMTGTIASDYRNYRKSWEEPEAFQPDFSLAYSGTVWLMRMTMLGRWIGVRTNLVKNWNLSAYVDRPWEGDADENATRNDGRYFERNTRYMIALAKQMGARIVLATTPFTERVWEVQQRLTLEHGEIVRRVAKLEDVAFYDFAAEMPADEEHLPDGVHVSQLGSDVKRDLYFDYLVRSGLMDALLGGEPPRDAGVAP